MPLASKIYLFIKNKNNNEQAILSIKTKEKKGLPIHLKAMQYTMENGKEI